ncbi:MAG: hypothetical protein IKZ52_06770 [Bacteroidales bacterium]|nr:hypothetical protein [Bacteroidales bacterium]
METHAVTTNSNGLMILAIGDGTIQNGMFSDIDWADGPYFLKTEIDPDGGSNYTITSTQQLLSVPYALYAKTAGNAFSGDYNDLTNTPDIPTVPTNVGAFTNDAGYLTSYTETDPTVPAWAKEANKPAYSYSEIANTPTIPTVPTNVSAFTNDAGYLTSYTETDPTVPAWAKEVNKPAYNYSEIANTPTIPTVPTNISAFTNDAGYLTTYTETDPQFTAWDKDYNDLINKPTIPTIPNNVSTFTNDAGYITAQDLQTIPSVPTNVSAFANDAGYITLDSIPAIPTVPTEVSVFHNDAGYITSIVLDSIMSSYIAGMQAQIDSLKGVIDSMEAIPVPGVNTAQLPTVTTDVVTVISSTTATSGGTVTSPDGTPVLSRGLCWSQHQNPTIDDNVAIAGLGQGQFSATMTGLTADTLYYVRAFAVTAQGVAYGQPRTFVSGNPNAVMVTVHFVSSDTSIAMVNQTDTTVIYGSTISFPGITGLSGWIVDYWVAENDTTTHISPLDNVTITSEITYYAHFKDNNVYVRFPGADDENTWKNLSNNISVAKNTSFEYDNIVFNWQNDGSAQDISGTINYYVPYINSSIVTTNIKIPSDKQITGIYSYANGWLPDNARVEFVQTLSDGKEYKILVNGDRKTIFGIKLSDNE